MLIEVAIAVVILGLAMLAIMGLAATTTQVASANTTAAESLQLARAGWEHAYGLGFDTVRNWPANPTAAPGYYIDDAQVYERRMWAEHVDVNDVRGPVLAGLPTTALRLRVEIYKRGTLVYQQSWLMSKS